MAYTIPRRYTDSVNRRWLRDLFVLPLLMIPLLAAACGGNGNGTPTPTPMPTPTPTPTRIPGATPTPTPIIATLGLKSELVTRAIAPAKLAFAPDGRLFYSEFKSRKESTGSIRIVTPDGELLPEPFAEVRVGSAGQWGLFGLAFDPSFNTNRYVYAYLIEPTPEDGGQAIVMRFTDSDNKGTDATVIIGDLPESDPEELTPHVGGEILFGPDGYLYVSLGDFAPLPEVQSGNPSPQNLGILQGKILRVKKEDGSPAPNNPFANTPAADPRIFAYGLRNVFDFTFHPETRQLYANDNGPENCDELNLVAAGQNYGWPQSLESRVEDCSNGQPVPPIHVYARPGFQGEDFGSNVAPTAIQFVTGDLYPSLAGSLLVCEFNTGFMRALVLGGDNQDQVVDDDVVVKDCTLDIAVGPDGVIYYSNGTEIRRLLPE